MTTADQGRGTLPGGQAALLFRIVEEFVSGLTPEQMSDILAERLDLRIVPVKPATCQCPCEHLGGCLTCGCTCEALTSEAGYDKCPCCGATDDPPTAAAVPTIPAGATEPSPHRDVGPYESATQARAQIDATIFGIPREHTAPGMVGEMVLAESLMLAGVRVAAWEDLQRQEITEKLSAETIQVIAGWILRAHLSGRIALE